MDVLPASPLTRQIQDTFQPKIVQLYSVLFTTNPQNATEFEDELPSEGFWREFFLLKPAKLQFRQILDPLSATDFLQIQRQTRYFVERSIVEMKNGSLPQAENALDNLTAFLTAALSKRYTNPSTDTIEILAGLESIDKVMTDLVNYLETTISKSTTATLRRKSVDCVVATVAGAYQTSLVTYFIHKDLFNGLVRFVQSESSCAPSVLSSLGLLANYNKFEAQNMYQSRMQDFVNDVVMKRLVEGYANTCGDIRDAYVMVQDDAPAQWSLGSTLSYVGLRALTPEAKKPIPPTEEEAKVLFNELPPSTAIILLGTYSFVQANKVFAAELISNEQDDDLESPLAAFLSATSYLCHHAFRSNRVHDYALLSLFVVRNLYDDTVLAKRLGSNESRMTCRLARQRPPQLPAITTPRIATSVVLDIVTDTLSHNLRKRISLPLYTTCLNILHGILTNLSATRTRLSHHWSYIWLSLISLMRFLTTYATDLQSTTRLSELRSQICRPLTSILTFSLLRGDNFLPDPASFDDLFYKLVEAVEVLSKFKESYIGTEKDQLSAATEALMSIASHYQNLVGKTKKHQSPRQIQEIIGSGHESLPEVVDGLNQVSPRTGGNEAWGHYEAWREAGWKIELKKIIRTVVDDAKVWVVQEPKI